MHKVCHQRIHSGNKDLQINNEKKILCNKRGRGEIEHENVLYFGPSPSQSLVMTKSEVNWLLYFKHCGVKLSCTWSCYLCFSIYLHFMNKKSSC